MTPINEELDNSYAKAKEYLHSIRLLWQRAKLEEGGQRFRTLLEMEALRQSWLEQRAKYTGLQRAGLKAPPRPAHVACNYRAK